ncbi:hypothetical protein [Bacillus amyloliquefaciens]|uniref:hypothetical protein n=1 Tax=Bacillus amyloliquefaciens TaxID=1390 RepID=UPI000206ED66|nr:hypothetical protein [Bacillus amyloliquefaciens]AEB62448.1 Putative oxidoreductase [Bacillus amyloliquefaciens LL3]MEC5260946.1 hypothetical protein [Bacillus amyloliquefaciens]
MKLKLANRSIFDSLTEATAKREMIVTNERQRYIGKTKALMLFAERKHLPVIVPQRLKRNYSKRYPHVQVLGDAEVTYIDALPLMLLCDEGVPKRTIEELKTKGHGVSGFLNESFNTIDCDENNLTFREIEPPPFLQIELDDIDSAPRIFYKGEQIQEIINADFSFLTNTELMNPTHIDIEYIDQDSKCGTKAIVHNRHLVSERN